MNDPDAPLEQWFQAAFSISEEQEDAFWRQFAEQELPEQQAWLSFEEAMQQASTRWWEAIRWTHWSVPEPLAA